MFNSREVLALMFEFILSLVGMIGSGFLLYEGRAETVATTVITAIITFWFARRMNEANNNKKDPPGGGGV